MISPTFEQMPEFRQLPRSLPLVFASALVAPIETIIGIVVSRNRICSRNSYRCRLVERPWFDIQRIVPTHCLRLAIHMLVTGHDDHHEIQPEQSTHWRAPRPPPSSDVYSLRCASLCRWRVCARSSGAE